MVFQHYLFLGVRVNTDFHFELPKAVYRSGIFDPARRGFLAASGSSSAKREFRRCQNTWGQILAIKRGQIS
jgi:hypothetical protein